MLKVKRREAPDAYESWNEYSAIVTTPLPQEVAPAGKPDGKIRKRLEIFFNFGGSFIYIMSAAALIIDYRHSERLSSLLMVVLVTLFAFFFIARTTPPKQTNTSARDWLVAICGTAVPLFFRPAPEVGDFVVTQAAQFLGMCISATGLLTLNNSFGMVAANRGIKTGGIYKYIRHPIYAGYLLAATGFLIQNCTPTNVALMAIWVAFEFSRIRAEEQFLSRDPAYAAYMKKTRWRVIPGVL